MSPRSSPAIAHVAPLAVFLLLNSLVPALAVENRALPWWRHAPEHWIYPLQTVICGVLLVWFRREYVFRPIRGLVPAIVLGAAGIAAWLLPGWLYASMDEGRRGAGVPLLGFAPREDGFDPSLFEGSPPWHAVVVAMRFARLVVVVPLVEEIFWRGFLMRYVIAGDRDFRRVPFGRHHWLGFAVTTAAFVAVHQRVDWLGALVFGTLMYVLCVRTKSLAACVAMHAVANLLLGAYVMATRQWGFW